MDRTQKTAFVADLSSRLSKAQSLVVAHYRGLNVKELTQLRRAMRAAGGEVQVAKNRLAKLAIKGTPFEGVTELLTGPTILTFSADDIAPSRISQKFSEANDNKLAILGGIMNGKMLTAADVKSLSNLPTLNELRGKLVGLLQAPGAQLARVTKAYADKGGASAPAEAAAPAEEAKPAEQAAPAPAEAAPAPAEAPAAEPQSN
ncbi:MAG: 50S ribosomal protein L10 [Proteobacteria bacterium]|nr:50S ribosomal protein L10 [Pseudomonadota bacterium]